MVNVADGREFQSESLALRKDGSTFRAGIHGVGLTFGGKPHILSVIQDITEQVEAYQTLERRVAERTKEISALLEVSHNVAATLELRPLLSLILDGLAVVLDYTSSAVSTVDERGVRIVDYRGPTDHPAEGDMVRFLEILSRHGPIRAGEAIIVPDVQGDSEWARSFRELAGPDLMDRFAYVRAFIAAPLMVAEKFTGLLTVVHTEPDHYSSEQLRLAVAMADQASLAIENARLYEQAQYAAAHEERARLARELHDSVTQALFSMTLHARAAQIGATRGKLDPTGPVVANLNQLAQLTQAALAEMRALIFELRPDALQEEGLASALRKHAGALSARQGITIKIQAPEARIGLRSEVEEQLYSLAREALHNAVKHSGSEIVTVCLDMEDSTVCLEVSDTGRGFDPAVAHPGHLGLKTMRERARMVGGFLEIESDEGKGTRVIVRVPHSRERSRTAPRRKEVVKT